MKKNSENMFLLKSMFLLLCFCLAAVPKTVVLAGSINSDEASVVSAASGTFTYNGKTYRALPVYIENLKDYLADDDVDLTAGQASSAISQMYSSVQQGVEDGYLYEVGGKDDPANNSSTEERPQSGIDINKDRDKENSGENNKKNNQVVDGDSTEKKDESEKKNTYASADSEGNNNSDKQIQLDKNAELEDIDNSEEEKDYTKEIEKMFSDSKEHSKNETKNSFIWVIIIIAILCLVSLIVWLVNVIIRKRRAVPYIMAMKEKGLTDLHCHILPGVDDGSKDLETSMEMVQIGYKSGVRRIIATPHYVPNHLTYNEEKLEKSFKMFSDELKKKYPDMECYLGNELYYQGQELDDLKNGKIHTMADSKYLLVEFSTKITYHDMYKAMKSIVQARYYPILAHMERFNCLKNHSERVDELTELGVYFQMNADSVLGKGADKKWCRKMLKENRIQFFGTDAHGVTHRTPEMEKAVKWIYEHIDPLDAEDLLINNPEKLLENKRID